MIVATAPFAILMLVAAQRVAELRLSRKNTAALIAEGGIEYGATHYPFFVLMHGSWLISLFVWLLIQQSAIQWVWIAVYIFLQAGRFWFIRTLGPYWTTRIISVPGRPLVNSGPYRFVRHPNYWIVVAEIAVLPMAFGSWQITVIFSFLNALLLNHRIKIENAVLDARR